VAWEDEFKGVRVIAYGERVKFGLACKTVAVVIYHRLFFFMIELFRSVPCCYSDESANQVRSPFAFLIPVD
jgi:hypothetical protein